MLRPTEDRQQLRLQRIVSLSVSIVLAPAKGPLSWTLNALNARLRTSASTNLGQSNVILRLAKGFMNVKQSQRWIWRQYHCFSAHSNISLFQSKQTAAIAFIAAAMSSKPFLSLAHKKSIANCAHCNLPGGCNMPDHSIRKPQDEHQGPLDACAKFEPLISYHN